MYFNGCMDIATITDLLGNVKTATGIAKLIRYDKRQP